MAVEGCGKWTHTTCGGHDEGCKAGSFDLQDPFFVVSLFLQFVPAVGGLEEVRQRRGGAI